MVAGAIAGRPLPTDAEFNAALDALVIVWPRDGEPFLSPTEGAVAELVAVWLEDTITANPALIQTIHERFCARPEAVPGVHVLPVAALKTALLATLRHDGAS